MSDILLRGNSMDGEIRVFTAVTTELVGEAQRIHKTYPTATAALGRVLTMSAIMGANLKNPGDSTTIQFKGDGPLGNIVAVCNNKSEVRGYVANPYVDIPRKANGKLDVGGAVGRGFLSVIRDLGMKEPYIGQVPIVTGEIAEDMTYYFAESEQIPTAIALGVLVNPDMTVKAAGGFMIQLMPEATDATAEKLEKKLKEIMPVTTMIESGMSAEDILFAVTDDFDMLISNDTVTPKYKCYCSKERMEKALISIGKTELEDLIHEQGSAELTCQFCDNKYTFGKSELEALLKEAK